MAQVYMNENIITLRINQVLEKKNTYLKEVQGDGVMVVVMEVDDEEEGGILVKLMPLW